MCECGAGDGGPSGWGVRIGINASRRKGGSGEVGLENVNHSGDNLNGFMVILEVERFYVVDGIDENEGEPVGKVRCYLEKDVVFFCHVV